MKDVEAPNDCENRYSQPKIELYGLLRTLSAIILFDVKLFHVPADKHQGPDGLSRHKPIPGKDDEDDPEDWIDKVLFLSLD